MTQIRHTIWHKAVGLFLKKNYIQFRKKIHTNYLKHFNYNINIKLGYVHCTHLKYILYVVVV